MAPKTSAKTSRRKPRHGHGELNIGNPGNAGGTGRPPDKFKEMCRDLSSSADVYREVQKILKRGSKDPCFLGALKWASEHGYGKPEQSLDVKSGGKSAAELLTLSWELERRSTRPSGS